MHPTVLIGLDGASFTVLDPLMAGGHMPRLAGLIGQGARAELLSTKHPLTPPAWTTLVTGQPPGNHGIYDFLRAEIRDGGAFFTLTNYRDIRCETIWTIVSRQSGQITSLNFPLMAPPPEVNGAIVPGLLSWRHLRRNVRPASLYDELKNLPDFNPQDLSWDFERERKGTQVIPDEELEEWVRFHLGRERQWFHVVEHLMKTAPADLTAVMFDGADKLQHSCWRFLDPKFQSPNPSGFERTITDLCVQYFRELDEYIGRIVDLAPAGARVFMASDHGFGPNDIILRINKWLEQKGYLRWASAPAAGAKQTAKTGNAHYVLLDWEHTTAFAQSGATNGIHIRIAQPGQVGGIPESEYASFRGRLRQELLEIRDPQDGSPILTDVWTREEIYTGQAMAEAPDLTLVLADHGFFSVLDVEPVVSRRDVIAGTHYPEGIFVAHGPGVSQGATLAQQSIVDIAPTLLYSLGLPIPEDFQGRVMQDAFTSEQLQQEPIRTGPPTESPGSQAAEAATDASGEVESEALILNRLRALGYVE
jgi:predicted AlkP superfamily phosphohydrolase/phosphomutase